MFQGRSASSIGTKTHAKAERVEGNRAVMASIPLYSNAHGIRTFAISDPQLPTCQSLRSHYILPSHPSEETSHDATKT